MSSNTPNLTGGRTASPGHVLALRIASALVMAPLALLAAWFGPPYFPLLVALLAIGMGYEWARLSGAISPAVTILVMLTPLVTVAVTALGLPLMAFFVAIGGALVTGLAARMARVPAPLWTAVGTLWLAVPCLAILIIDQGANRRAAILWLFAVVWASDIGAYAAGRMIGGPKLAPHLSPNKTWAGALGGFLCAGIVGGIAATLIGASLWAMIATSLLLAIAAQLGDLMESLAKRRFGAKDSGTLIPGHGGLLDRLDSLLTAAAMLALLFLLGFTKLLGLQS